LARTAVAVAGRLDLPVGWERQVRAAPTVYQQAGASPSSPAVLSVPNLSIREVVPPMLALPLGNTGIELARGLLHSE
jgi:hypothetical protein